MRCPFLLGTIEEKHEKELEDNGPYFMVSTGRHGPGPSRGDLGGIICEYLSLKNNVN